MKRFCIFIGINIFVVLTMFVLAKRTSAQVLDFQKEFGKPSILIEEYVNAPFPHEGEEWANSNVFTLLPSTLDRNSEKINVVLCYHGHNTDISEGPFVESMKAGFMSVFGKSKNTILVCPQLAFNAKSSSAGRLEEKDIARKLILESFSRNDIERPIGEVTVVSYSGGYKAAVRTLQNNPGLNIKTVIFLDTLYWHMENVLDWYWENESRKVIVVCSREKESQNVLRLLNGLLDYAEEKRSYTDNAENVFITGNDFWKRRLLLIETERTHEQVPGLMEVILKGISDQ